MKIEMKEVHYAGKMVKREFYDIKINQEYSNESDSDKIVITQITDFNIYFKIRFMPLNKLSEKTVRETRKSFQAGIKKGFYKLVNEQMV